MSRLLAFGSKSAAADGIYADWMITWSELTAPVVRCEALQTSGHLGCAWACAWLPACGCLGGAVHIAMHGCMPLLIFIEHPHGVDREAAWQLRMATS